MPPHVRQTLHRADSVACSPALTRLKTSGWSRSESRVSWCGSRNCSYRLQRGADAGRLWFASQHGQQWGGAVSSSGAVQATLVSNAPSIPIPSPQTPTDNVLATETPSPAPAPPAAETKPQTPPPDAIPIPEKITPPKPARSRSRSLPRPSPLPGRKCNRTPSLSPFRGQKIAPTSARPLPPTFPAPTPTRSGAGPVSVMGDFGSRYGWYVDVIKRKAAQNWYRAEVDPKHSCRHARLRHIRYRTRRIAQQRAHRKVQRQSLTRQFGLARHPTRRDFRAAAGWLHAEQVERGILFRILIADSSPAATAAGRTTSVHSKKWPQHPPGPRARW